jgi:predicted nucleic acid-binding protein
MDTASAGWNAAHDGDHGGRDPLRPRSVTRRPAVTALQQAADEVLAAFPNQVLPFDVAAASLYGQIAAARERAGHPVDALDTQIAAICRAHDAPLATRNTKDFAHTGIHVVDPWSG